jgi:hypothetical protein
MRLEDSFLHLVKTECAEQYYSMSAVVETQGYKDKRERQVSETIRQWEQGRHSRKSRRLVAYVRLCEIRALSVYLVTQNTPII